MHDIAKVFALGLSGAFLLFAPVASALEFATYASVGPETSVPIGWFEFCQRHRDECAGPAAPARDIELTAKALKDVERINVWVNHSIEPTSDMEHYGVIDYWEYPYDAKGDCDAYVLLKRKLLIEQGYPREALLITIVKDQHNEGHAILTLRSDRGEFVLDNMNDKILPWTKTPYRFVKRQSLENQNTWVALGEPVAEPLYVSLRKPAAHKAAGRSDILAPPPAPIRLKRAE